MSAFDAERKAEILASVTTTASKLAQAREIAKLPVADPLRAALWDAGRRLKRLQQLVEATDAEEPLT